ncbi:MAG TPA: hypothetical protein VH540_03200 [Ktedonobacterales bacterium]|jgi:Flp pilus assembly protein TadG
MRRCSPPHAAPRPRRKQRGQALIIFAFLITFLILLLGLVIDSVRLYILTAQAERAAEAGAFAGALYMPDYYNTVSPDGQDAVLRVCAAVQQNGVTACPVSVGQLGAAPAQVSGNPYLLRVTVTLQANVFFLSFVLPGVNTANVSRSAQAQYLPPIALGARHAYFGDQSNDDATGSPVKVPLQNFWANINGPLEIKENGDAYSTTWEEGWTDPQAHPDGGSFTNIRLPLLNKTNNPQHVAAILNPNQQPNGFTGAGGRLGYNYQIIVPPGSGNVTIQIYNAAFDPGQSSSGTATNDRLLSGPSAPGNGGSNHIPSEYMQVTYSIYSAPLQFERAPDTLLASFSPPSLDFYTGNGCSGGQALDTVAVKCVTPGDTVRKWHPFYTITNPGSYRLVVESSVGYGSHNYGLKLTDSSGNIAGNNVRIWGWNNMNVYFGVSGISSTFDLGQIPAAYAGKTLHFSLFDPGDSSGEVDMEILDPTGTPVKLPAWMRTVGGSGGTKLQASNSSGDELYNGQWLDVPVPIPTTYNPAPGSDWWTVRYTLGPGSTPTDVVTISIALSGSPIHLVQLVP